MDKNKKKNVQTIDEKHNDLMQMYFVIENETIPNLQKEVQSLLHKANTTKQKKNEKYYELLDTIKAKKQELKHLQDSKNKYLLKNSKYIFHYYEEKQKINTGENIKDKTSINNFFRCYYFSVEYFYWLLLIHAFVDFFKKLSEKIIYKSSLLFNLNFNEYFFLVHPI